MKISLVKVGFQTFIEGLRYINFNFVDIGIVFFKVFSKENYKHKSIVEMLYV